MNHKAGDTVRIRSREWIDAQEKDEDGDIMRDTVFLHKMFQYAGKLAVITYVHTDDTYSLDIDGGYYWWADWMFDPDYRAGEPLSPKDAIIAMIRDEETLYDKDGREYDWDEDNDTFSVRLPDGTYENNTRFAGLYRRSAKRKRLMTRWEILGWANSEASRGWVVRIDEECDWNTPQFPGYNFELDNYQRARLLPDLSGVDKDTIQRFEVEE
jgi:hypothetical protein